MIVVDASAVIEYLLRSPSGSAVEVALAQHEAASPELVDAEAFQRLVGFEKTGRLRTEDVDGLVSDLAGAAIVRFEHRVLLTASRQYTASLSAYDALYVALAGLLDATLVTADAHLAATATEQFGLPVTTILTSGR